MKIDKIVINNFKCYHGKFSMDFHDGLNIIVGDNETGKSTILSAIQLALSGILDGKYFQQEVNEYIINKDAVLSYVKSIQEGTLIAPPKMVIELYFDAEAFPESKGSLNLDRDDTYGIKFTYELDESLNEAYELFIKNGEVESVPIEYYKFGWSTFSGMAIIPRNIPVKSVLIDSSEHRNSNGSDIHVNRIVKDFLGHDEKIQLTQAHRRMKSGFMGEDVVIKVNQKISDSSNISDKSVQLSIDVSSKNRWENSLVTYLDDIPFHYVGKGEQCLIKTKLALEHKKTNESSVILIEEPENHLSHSKLNKLIRHILSHVEDKQIIISTHSSFVANTLGLENLILLNNQKSFSFKDLDSDTTKFFKKLPGYNTLRLILCSKAILVEGDSDELVVQRAYLDYYGVLPIENEVDVISVGLSFLRFLSIAEVLKIKVAVVTDTDGDIDAIDKKYAKYLGDDKVDHIDICVDRNIDTGTLVISGKPFNYNTLEPKLLKANSLQAFNSLFSKSYTDVDDMYKFMKSNKTECALKIFESEEKIAYPEFILQAIDVEVGGGNDTIEETIQNG